MQEPRQKLPVALLVFGRKRPGFDQEWGAGMEVAARAALAALDVELFCPSAAAVDDASLRSAIEEIGRSGNRTIVVVQPTMGDGRLVPLLAQLWTDPLVLWATPEKQDTPKVSSCSLVGMHMAGSLLAQMGRPFELVYGPPDEAPTRSELFVAIRLARMAARIRRAKIGLVGGHAPGFINMRADPVLLARRLGAQLHELSLPDFFALVTAQDQKAVESDVERVLALGIPLGDGLRRDDLLENSRYYLAMRSLMAEENLDALAVRCWPEMPAQRGAWPYLAESRLADQRQIVALEGDVDGAISCLIARMLGAWPAYISDWLEHDSRSILLWHPGQAPRAICQPGSLRLGRHFSSGHPVVVNAALTVDQPITLLRLWQCDGSYRLAAWEGRTVTPRRELWGVYGEVEVSDRDVREWFDQLCHAGMPHHVTVALGHHAKTLRRAARLLGLNWE